MCDMIPMLSYLFRQRKGGVGMGAIIVSFLVAVAAGVVSHIVCNWLDSKEHDV